MTYVKRDGEYVSEIRKVQGNELTAGQAGEPFIVNTCSVLAVVRRSCKTKWH